jgi:diguanylate cyclase (GGDEF)-like protein
MIALPPNMDPTLANSPLFSSMSQLEFNAVTAFMERRNYKAGECVFHEGDEGEDMFVLISGSLTAQKRQSDGTMRWMFNISPGSFLGEMSIIMNEPRSATITAKEDSMLMVLQGIDFYRIIFEHPIIGIKMLDSIGSVQSGWLNQNSSYLRDLIQWGETARRRAITDELTGLYNRNFLEESLNDRFKSGAVKVRKMAVIMMDLDKVHAINDRYGAAGGDKVIVSTASIVKHTCRPGDIAARLAGDEFAIMLPDTSGEDAIALGDRIREKVATHAITLQHLDSNATNDVYIRTSLGISVAPDHGNSVRELLFNADIALRKAKEMGRNRVELYAP